jgi:divalent metal cation (Fe/Co/Zn/Cd) transporter
MKAVAARSPYGSSSFSCHHYNHVSTKLALTVSLLLFFFFINNNFDSLFSLVISCSSMSLYLCHMHDYVSIMLISIYQLVASMYMAGDVKTIRYICLVLH